MIQMRVMHSSDKSWSTVDSTKASSVIMASWKLDKPWWIQCLKGMLHNLENIKGKASYDWMNGQRRGFRWWQGYHEVGLSVSLPSSHARNSRGLIYRYSALCSQHGLRPQEASLMSVHQNCPKTASNMLFFASEICYCVQGCHIPMRDYMWLCQNVTI